MATRGYNLMLGDFGRQDHASLEVGLYYDIEVAIRSIAMLAMRAKTKYHSHELLS